MQQIKDKELKSIYGGGISAAMINAIVRGATLLFEMGRSLGSAIKRGISRNYCK